MQVRVVLVDINPKMIAAWKDAFEHNPEVDIVQGSMLDQHVSAWVSPTNARASMDGGLDAIIKRQLGPGIQNRVQAAVRSQLGATFPLGTGVCVATDAPLPRYLISTPTMLGSSDNISASLNVALACCAAFQTVHMQNMNTPGSIRSVALPGLGAATGKTPVEICADLMWTAYSLFRNKAFSDFTTMRKALEEVLGDLGTFGDTMKSSAGKASVFAKTSNVNAPAPSPLPPDPTAADFDDADIQKPQLAAKSGTAPAAPPSPAADVAAEDFDDAD